jgi:hypothetical protein
VSNTRNLRITLALFGAAAVASFAPAASQASVCNEATEGQRGDLVATGTPDPDPPARYKTDLAALPGKGGGLQIAAERSGALTQCGPGDDGSGGGDDGTGGGDDGTGGGDDGSGGGDDGTGGGDDGSGGDDDGEIIGGGGGVVT